MNIQQHEQQLGQAYTSNDPAIKDTALSANQYTQMFKGGELTKEEYIQAMSDLATQARINTSMNDLANLEMLNTAITGLITLATLA
jgi:hypothetical protein